MVAPDWVCLIFALALYVCLPLDAWLVAWPSAVKFRNKLVRPVYRHEIKD